MRFDISKIKLERFGEISKTVDDATRELSFQLDTDKYNYLIIAYRGLYNHVAKWQNRYNPLIYNNKHCHNFFTILLYKSEPFNKKKAFV